MVHKPVFYLSLLFFCVGTDSGSVAALFRTVGAHYFNHFSVVFLHGSTLRKHDSDCRLGDLYPLREALQLSFEQGRLRKADKLSFRKGISQFVEHDFPFWYPWWTKSVGDDPDVCKAVLQVDLEPAFDPTKHLKVAFAKTSQRDNLRNVCLNEDEKIKNSNLRNLSKYEIQAANLNGHLLSKIQECGREDNIGVILAISNTLGSDDPPPLLEKALNKIICYFVFAVINAGLQLGKMFLNVVYYTVL